MPGSAVTGANRRLSRLGRMATIITPNHSRKSVTAPVSCVDRYLGPMPCFWDVEALDVEATGFAARLRPAARSERRASALWLADLRGRSRLHADRAERRRELRVEPDCIVEVASRAL